MAKSKRNKIGEYFHRQLLLTLATSEPPTANGQWVHTVTYTDNSVRTTDVVNPTEQNRTSEKTQHTAVAATSSLPEGEQRFKLEPTEPPYLSLFSSISLEPL